MSGEWVEQLPDRTVAMIRGFSPALNRSILVGGAISIAVTRLPRAEILAFIGRYEQARAEIVGAPTDAPEDAELASLRQYIDWLEHGTVDTSELAAAAATLPPGTDGKAIASVTIALAQARDRFIRRDPTWSVPLESARPAIGRAASLVALRDTWSKLGGLFFAAALISAIIVILLR